ncbi:multicopper oxidase domain-containing protein [Phenylobacterium soli]|uniref:Copper oxidase n=1 Tax=Phenylobacterium soli TaxID=2170551 RepID=A0A328AKG1_9CAUL|nr:multicopper oxidase domain-containing protein [Phenylobacterium soli]RAK54961.1 copper oxidase [Phenylobacterium soli]
MLTRRRTIVAGGSLIAGSTLFGAPSGAQPGRFTTPLPVPPLIDAQAQGNSIRLVAQTGRHAFVEGRPVATYGYSGPVLGPTIRMQSGAQVDVAIENRIDTDTIVHWHGFLIPSERDGGPHDHIAPGETWRRVLPVQQPETTAWYHPHPHRDTGRQVYFGMAGLVLIEDGSGARLDLPRTYGVDDLPLVLQDRLFDGNGDLIYPANPMTVMQGARGNTIIVNGAIAPIARVPAGLVRLRLLNGSNARNLDLGFDDGRPLHVIASDGGYLGSPVSMTRLLIAPSERFEILVDFSDGRPAVLQTGPDPFPPMMGMMMGRGQSAAGDIMSFAPDRDRPGAKRKIPSTLVDMPAAAPSAQLLRRRFALNDMGGMMGGMGGMMGRGMMGGMMGGGMMGGGMMGGGMMGMGRGGSGLGINGQSFDMQRIDVAVALDSREVWEVSAQSMAHPFHVHGVQFRILSLDGAAPPPHLQGWKDTVLVSRSAELLIHFTQPALRAHPFMFHCHILEHEDAGMMGQYVCA